MISGNFLLWTLLILSREFLLYLICSYRYWYLKKIYFFFYWKRTRERQEAKENGTLLIWTINFTVQWTLNCYVFVFISDWQTIITPLVSCFNMFNAYCKVLHQFYSTNDRIWSSYTIINNMSIQHWTSSQCRNLLSSDHVIFPWQKCIKVLILKVIASVLFFSRHIHFDFYHISGSDSQRPTSNNMESFFSWSWRFWCYD